MCQKIMLVLFLVKHFQWVQLLNRALSEKASHQWDRVCLVMWPFNQLIFKIVTSLPCCTFLITSILLMYRVLNSCTIWHPVDRIIYCLESFRWFSSSDHHQEQELIGSVLFMLHWFAIKFHINNGFNVGSLQYSRFPPPLSVRSSCVYTVVWISQVTGQWVTL